MKSKILGFLLIVNVFFVYSQTKLADKFFKNYGYVKAIELYEKAYEKGDDSKHVLTRLGDAYYNNSNSQKAAYWYGEALKKYKNIDAEYIYKHIQALRSIGNFEEADKWFKELSAAQAGDSRLKGYNPDEVDIYDKLTGTSELVVTIENLEFNSPFADFGGYVHNNTMYFASSRDESSKIYDWNKEPFLDLYQVNLTQTDNKITFNNFGDKIVSKAINSDYHEASIAITNDGNTLYFTRDDVNKRNKLQYNKEGTTHLKIYKAEFVEGKWSNIKELPFNDNKYSTGHPTLSPDNKRLYFVSDREGGFGQTDIYSVLINDDGTYGEPKNLGDTINTEGREMFPYISKDSTLYFSSDGYLNLGLLDVFKSKILKEDNASKPENLGAPINSGYDDFAFFIDSDTQTGFFSSNRPNGKGSDDIYSFNITECKQTITGTVKDSKTGTLLSEVAVKLIDETGKIIEDVVTQQDGTYTFSIECDKSYTVVGEKTDYKPDQKSITSNFDNEKNNILDLNLEPLIIDNQIVINPIFFDFDKWDIRTDAQYELENIIDVLRKHPTMVIKIESHTDSRGSKRYNRKLSDRRAKSTRDYILSRGIDTSRIESAIGYGEDQLLNKCFDGVKCTKEEHQLNRRSYFYILKH